MLDDLKDLFHHFKVYLFGKGILTLGVFAAAAIGAATGIGVIIPALVVAIGGVALTAADRLSRQAMYENEMVDLYRNNIAEQLGKPPADITRADLMEAAKDNDVIAQALKRQHQRTLLAIGTSMLSGGVSLALIAGFGVGGMLHHMAEQTFLGMLKPIAAFIGIGTVSGITGLVLKQGLGSAIGYGTGIHKAAAHDLIVRMNHDVTRGMQISREDVYAIIVAANPALDKSITAHYGRHYTHMSHAQQSHVLHDVALAGAMDKLALAISSGAVSAGTVAYAANDPRLTVMPTGTIDAADAMAPEPENGKFIERLGLTPRTASTNVERVQQQRMNAPAAQLS